MFSAFGTTLEPALDYERAVPAPRSHRDWTMPLRPANLHAYPWGTGRAMPVWGKSAITPNGQVIPLSGAEDSSQLTTLIKAGDPKKTIGLGALSGVIIGGSGHRIMGAIGGALAGAVAAFYLGQLRAQLNATATAVVATQQKAST